MSQKAEDNSSEGFQSGLEVENKFDIAEPRMYRVIMHNDNYTTMDFVVEILMEIFSKSAAEATKIMMDIHRKGKGICGVYIYDIAVTKIAEVHRMAKKNDFPLKCSYEEA